jgi:GTP-binding protein
MTRKLPGPARDGAPMSGPGTRTDILFRRPWRFVMGAPSLDHLPPADRPEVALAGRSNVGKSSLINALVGRLDLARTSNTPGRTQELNFFVPEDGSLALVDMPGYGFAKAPKEKVDTWTETVKGYLAGRVTLKRAFLLIDSRHGIKPVDTAIMRMLDTAAVTFEVVLTKIDKIGTSALGAVEARTRAALAAHPAAFPVVRATSAETGAGIDDLRLDVLSACGLIDET